MHVSMSVHTAQPGATSTRNAQGVILDIVYQVDPVLLADNEHICIIISIYKIIIFINDFTF